MTNDPLYNQLRERSWRRKLTAGEAAELRAWLATHPEAQTDWEAEAGLNEALGWLPDAPVGSNFTARVLQSIELDRAAELRRQRRKWQAWLRWRWLPKAAVATMVLVAGLVSYQQVAKVTQRAEYAQSVAVVSDVSSLPGPEVLKDFDAILVSNPTPSADVELLTALQ
jgi:hypothetical protein